MSETKIIIDNLLVSYEGLFSVKEYYKFLDGFFSEKNYDKRETINMEKVEPKGKFIEFEIEPFKKLSDYAKLVIRVNTKMFNIKEVEVEKDDHKIRLNQGRVNILIDGILVTDWENRWTDRPLYVFTRIVFDKFIFKNYIDSYEAKLESEVGQLQTQMKAFLNLYRY